MGLLKSIARALKRFVCNLGGGGGGLLKFLNGIDSTYLVGVLFI